MLGENQTEAAISAGASPRSAHVIACKWLKIDKVAAFLAKEQAKLDAKLDISAEKILKGIHDLAFFDIRKLYREDGTLIPIHELDAETATAISGFEIEEAYEHFGKGNAKPTGLLKKFKLADRGINLERLGRHKKLFTDKLEMTDTTSLSEAIRKARERAKR